MNRSPLESILIEADYATRSHVGSDMGTEECLAVVIPKHDTVFRMVEAVIDTIASSSLGEDELAEVSRIIGHGKIEPFEDGQIVFFPGWAHSSEIERNRNGRPHTEDCAFEIMGVSCDCGLAAPKFGDTFTHNGEAHEVVAVAEPMLPDADTSAKVIDLFDALKRSCER